MIEKSEITTIGKLITIYNQFKAQKYQRGYSWEKEDVEDFWEDIYKIYNSSNKNDTHFFGGIICINQKDYLEIVDGQQRISTFTILLSLIVNALKEIKESENAQDLEKNRADNIINEIENKYLNYTKINDNGDSIIGRKLELTEVDKNFFIKLISGNKVNEEEIKRDSHEKILASWNYIKEKIDEIIKNKDIENKIIELNKLFKTIEERCVIVLMLSNDKNEAYQLFMVLNDRGRNLSVGDLLKTETLLYFEQKNKSSLININQDIHEIQCTWDKILKEKENIVEDFLRIYYTSKNGKRPSKTNLFDDFIKDIFELNNKTDVSNVKDEIIEMNKEYDIYLKISNGEWPYTNSKLKDWHKDRLKRLINILKHTSCLPLLIVASYKLDEKNFYKIVHTLELFVFRYINICDIHAGRLSKIYYESCMKIRDNKFKLDEFKSSLTELEKETYNKIFCKKLLNKLVYNKNNKSSNYLIKHFLTTIEDYYDYVSNGNNNKNNLNPNMTNVWDLKAIEIEHIYPQTAQNKDENLEQVKNNLPNLSFWGPNGNKIVGNNDFSTKKQEYNKSNINLNKHLCNYSNWTIVEYEERKKVLLSWADKLFRVH